MSLPPPDLEAELETLTSAFHIPRETLKTIVSRFRAELADGLAENGRNIPMNLTWVHRLPSGAEQGTFLTLDLGGTNLRVCRVELHGRSKEVKYTVEQERYVVPAEIKTGDAEQLWGYVAEKLDVFLRNKGIEGHMALGFTFSYPATQGRIDSGVLQTWTKGLDIAGVEGEDVAMQLRHAMQKRKLPIDLVCLVNDTVGALVASAYTDPHTIIGAIFGTGCNAAYMSSLSSIGKLKTPPSPSDRKMAINCEYGAFDNAHAVLPRTPYDVQVDKASPRPGEQAFEKLSAGHYLGEIFRLVLLDLCAKSLVFQHQDINASKLNEAYVLDTGILSEIENDDSPSCTRIRDLFESTLGLEITDEEARICRRLAEVIAVRGARLCACGIAAICLNEGITQGHVAADGAVANKHPQFKERWARALGEILDWEEGENPIQITSAEDGSGVGCAIVAAMEMERRGER